MAAYVIPAKQRKIPHYNIPEGQMPKKYTAHVVSHTHWDREWYKSFQHFRMRLVDLTDSLIGLMENDPDFKYFNFDGQTIVLEDYLAIRPENEDRLRRLISDDRILIGPWYNLPDEFLVSGECIIRNILKGKKICADYGSWQSVGYIPDQFGHISQMPQIFAGFGIDNAVLFRGITTDQVKSEFNWKGPDGTEILVVKMPDNNAYSNWFYRCRELLADPETKVDKKKAVECVKGLLDDCIKEKPTTSQLLFMDGCDHVFPQFKTPEIIKAANKKIDNLEIKHSTLPDFIESVRNERPKLETIEGELRVANRKYRLQALLTHVLSSRIHLKQMSHYCETLLEKYVEPLYTFAYMQGEDYPKPYIDLAWQYLLKNSPHDSICGCSIDQVHKDMVYRYDQTIQIAEKLMQKALNQLSGRIAWKKKTAEKSLTLSVFNTLGHERTDTVETTVNIPADWNPAALKLTDGDQQEMDCAIIGVKDIHEMEPEPFDIPLGTHKREVKITFTAENVPALGYKAYNLEFPGVPNRKLGHMLLGPDTAENDHIAITVSSDGTFYLLDKENDRAYTTFMVFEDGGDVGDGWNYRKPAFDKVVTSLGAPSQVNVIENSPVRVVFEVVTRMELPEKIAPDRQSRSCDTVSCTIKSYITLGATSRRVDVKTVVENPAKDHRLRVLFPTGIQARHSYAEQAFDVCKRDIELPECTDWAEPQPPEHPMKTFVDISDDDAGLAILTKGLQEYEVKDDEARTIAITLLRAVGTGVGGPDAQKEGQMPGTYAFDYSIYPHAGDWLEGEVAKQAHAFNVPFVCGQSECQKKGIPESDSFVKIAGDGFVVSALKKAEDSDSIVLRGYNIGQNDTTVTLAADDLKAVESCNLAEESTSTIDVKNGKAKLTAGPKQIATVKLIR